MRLSLMIHKGQRIHVLYLDSLNNTYPDLDNDLKLLWNRTAHAAQQLHLLSGYAPHTVIHHLQLPCQTNNETGAVLKPGIYMFEVLSDTLIIKKMGVPGENAEKKIEKETQEDVKVATPKIKSEIEDVKYSQGLEEDQIDLMAR
jgi:hypothetical protein